MPCDPQTLQQNAKCLECIPERMQLPVLINLFCQIANKPPPTGNFRITEQNDFRLTEQGDNRIIEQ